MKRLLVVCVIMEMARAGGPVYLEHKNSWAYDTLQSLTLKQKIGQLFVVAAASNTSQPTESLATAFRSSPYNMKPEFVEEMVQDHEVGGVIFLFKSKPEAQMALMNKLQKKAHVPLLIVQDAEWGLSMRLDGDPAKVVRYPRNMTLGAIGDPQLVYEMGYEVGRQCAAIGVHMNCAPVVDVNNNAANPVIHDRSFGDDPELVAKLAAAYANGLQDAGVIACIKHYPGHGDTTVDSHLSPPYIKHDRERLHMVELAPFKKLIDEGTGAVMMAHLVVPALDATNKLSSMSYSMVTHELKNNLGFKGLVVTDGLGMEAVTQLHQPGDLELEAFLAGNDILLCPLDVPGAIARIEQAINDGRVFQEDLDNRVLKILQAKAWVFDQQKERNKDIDDVHSFLIRPEAYALQKKLYRNAITVVKDANILPVYKDAIATSCMIQVGAMPENALGVAWAKAGGAVHTCIAALSDEAMNSCLVAAECVKTVIIGVGEMNKFATQKYGVADNTRALVTQLQRMGKKVVVILFGTPYSASYFKDADTIIVAYEDVAVAQEAAVDVVLGALHATGTLPVAVSI